jgi:hypothetical protein
LICNEECVQLRAEIDRLHKALDLFFGFDLSQTFDAKGSYSGRKAVELTEIRRQAQALREE